MKPCRGVIPASGFALREWLTASAAAPAHAPFNAGRSPPLLQLRTQPDGRHGPAFQIQIRCAVLVLLRRSSRRSDQRMPDGVDVAVAMETLRDRRARLQRVVCTRCESEGCGPCSAPLPCAGYQAIEEVLNVVACPRSNS